MLLVHGMLTCFEILMMGIERRSKRHVLKLYDPVFPVVCSCHG